MKTAVIIAAAGSGSRYGAPLPKQFCTLLGRPLLMTTIDGIRAALPEARIVLVLNAFFTDEWLDMCLEHGFSSPAIVEGGETRWASVSNALRAISQTVDVVLVHDGARPVVSADVVTEVVTAIAAGRQGAIPMTAPTDSMRQVAIDGSTTAVDRSLLRCVQTPQGFNARLLRRAYAMPYSPEFTDDASVMEAAGFTDIAEIRGDYRNIKVTRPGDIRIAEIYLSELK